MMSLYKFGIEVSGSSNTKGVGKVNLPAHKIVLQTQVAEICLI